MRPATMGHRAGRSTWVLLLVALLVMVGVSIGVPAHGAAVPGRSDAGVAAGSSPLEAIAPSRSVGAHLTEQSPHGLIGLAPREPAGTGWVRWDSRPAPRLEMPAGALRGVAGMRGPPHVMGFEK